METALSYAEAGGRFLLNLLILPFDEYYVWWLKQYEESPNHLILEAGLIFLILWVTFVKQSYNPVKHGYGERRPDNELTEKEVEQMVKDWNPEPLAPELKDGVDPADEQVVISAVQGVHVTVEGQDSPVLNMASHDFLGLTDSAASKVTTSETLEEYGCGTCGPRGFYGTSQKHLDLEGALAKFMDVDEAICYSDAVSCVASAVAAFVKRGDLLVMDDGSNHAVQLGATLSRANIVTFEHNNMDDLDRVLRECTAKDNVTGRNKTQRRFILCEGIYKNYGDICPLPDVVDLKKRYKFRLLVDETLSFGVLGETGKGLTEHFEFDAGVIDVMVASLATSLGAIGGFCAGSTEVVDHQRLSGAGYCYSASAPPFTCAVAKYALDQLSEDPGLLGKLHDNVQRTLDGLSSVRGMMVESAPLSPVIHLRLLDAAETEDAEQDALLQLVVEECLAKGVLISRSRYLSTEFNTPPPPSLKILVTAGMKNSDIDKATRVVSAAAKKIL